MDATCSLSLQQLLLGVRGFVELEVLLIEWLGGEGVGLLKLEGLSEGESGEECGGEELHVFLFLIIILVSRLVYKGFGVYLFGVQSRKSTHLWYVFWSRL